MIKSSFIVGIIFLLISSTFVYAAGSSSGGSTTRTTNSSASQSRVTTCEDQSDLRSRIRCRFENPEVARNESSRSVEEACRGIASQVACERLYNRSASCYQVADPRAKKRCFLNESGININAGGTFRAAPDETKRNYVILLLYELQDRIERLQANSSITTDEASSLVAKIVEIKRMILNKEKRSDIVVKINEFKTEYRSVIGGI